MVERASNKPHPRTAEAEVVLAHFRAKGMDKDEMPALSVILQALDNGLAVGDLKNLSPGLLSQKLNAIEQERSVQVRGTTRYGSQEQIPRRDVTDDVVVTIHEACRRVTGNDQELPSQRSIRYALHQGVPEKLLIQGCTDDELSRLISNAEKNATSPVSSIGETLIDADYERAAQICEERGLIELASKVRNRQKIRKDEYFSDLMINVRSGIISEEYLFVQRVVHALESQGSTSSRIREWARGDKVNPHDIPTESQLRQVRSLRLDENQLVGMTRDDVKKLLDNHYDQVLLQFQVHGTEDEKTYAKAFSLRREFWNRFGAKRRLDRPSVADVFVALSLGNAQSVLQHRSKAEVQAIVRRSLKIAYLGISMEEALEREREGSLETLYTERLRQDILKERKEALKTIDELLQVRMQEANHIPLSELHALIRKFSDASSEQHCEGLPEILRAAGLRDAINVDADLTSSTKELEDLGAKKVDVRDIEKLDLANEGPVSSERINATGFLFFVQIREAVRPKYTTDADGYVVYAKTTPKKGKKGFMVGLESIKFSSLVARLKNMSQVAEEQTASTDAGEIHQLDMRQWRSEIEKRASDAIAKRCREVDRQLHDYQAWE